MTDSAVMIILGIGMILRGCSYVPVVLGAPPRSGSHPVEFILDIQQIGWAWIVIGLVTSVLAFMHHPRLDALFLGLAVGLHVMWGGSFVFATITGGSPRGWVSSISYFMVAAIVMWAVWRGKRGDMPSDREWGMHG
ncbi:hypothetical protein [Corynebacterium ciconiae]|uniref:hypothetical protein n=1 Tax=Corynebacterium ciconiae TaxID=227319 RepID=UPI002647BAAA|nr:hypothetical protein [Corynebacterium ciconiae]